MSTNEIPSTSQQALDGPSRTVDKIQVIHTCNLPTTCVGDSASTDRFHLTNTDVSREKVTTVFRQSEDW